MLCTCAQSCQSLQTHGLQPTSFLCPWKFPGKSTGEGSHFFLQRTFQTQGLKPCLLHPLHWQVGSLQADPPRKPQNYHKKCSESVSHSGVSNSANPWTVAHQASLSMKFTRQEYWSRQPFCSPGESNNSTSQYLGSSEKRPKVLT